VFSTPEIANGVVYFGSNDNYIYAVNESTGALIWRHLTGSAVTDTPVVAPW
jgi:outer membrane protein assembly factor BamB